MRDNLDFFKTSMPKTREADFYLGCRNGSVFIDFNRTKNNLISLVRISFDGYGCCNLNENVQTLNTEDSELFLKQMSIDLMDQNKITSLVKKAIKMNRQQIWTDALHKYDFIKEE